MWGVGGKDCAHTEITTNMILTFSTVIPQIYIYEHEFIVQVVLLYVLKHKKQTLQVLSIVLYWRYQNRVKRTYSVRDNNV